MGGAKSFYSQPGQQQAEDNTKNPLFLLRQAIHIPNVTR